MDRISRQPDGKLRRDLKTIDHHIKWYEKPFKSDISNEQKAVEKARIVVTAVNRLADEATEAVTWFEDKKVELREEYRGIEQFQQQLLRANPGGLSDTVLDRVDRYKKGIADDMKAVEKMERDYQKHIADMLHLHYRTFFAIQEAHYAQNKQMRHDLFFGTIKALNNVHMGGTPLKDLWESLMKLVVEGKQ